MSYFSGTDFRFDTKEPFRENASTNCLWHESSEFAGGIIVFFPYD